MHVRYAPEIREALAVYRGIKLACECGLTPVLVETDGKVLVDHVNSGLAFVSEVGLVIFLIYQ
jgi:hypothetical protein